MNNMDEDFRKHDPLYQNRERVFFKITLWVLPYLGKRNVVRLYNALEAVLG